MLSPQINARSRKIPEKHPLKLPSFEISNLGQFYNRVNIPEENLGPPEINENEIEILSPLSTCNGQSFAIVHKGRCRSKDVAVKVLSKQNFSEQEMKKFMEEIKTLASVSHPNICLFMGATTKNSLMIVNEFLETNVYNLLQDKDLNLSLYMRMHMAKDAALGLNWLHDGAPVILHGGLTPFNLLVNRNFSVKVSDFGLYKLKPDINIELEKKNSPSGRLVWCAPEVLRGEPMTGKCDVYSFGLVLKPSVLWMLFTSEVPFSGLNTGQLIEEVCDKKEMPPISADMIESLKHLIEECWHENSVIRPPFAGVIRRLENILVDSAVLDQDANVFWKKNFKDKAFVDWTTFINAFTIKLGVAKPQLSTSLTINKKTNQNNYNDELLQKSIACLRAILVEKCETNGLPRDVVFLESFGKVISWFGPLHPDSLDKDGSFLERVRKIVCNPWFHGNLGAKDSERLLSDKETGTYLVRFSTSSFGAYTISKVANKETRTIHHQRFLHDLKQDVYIIKEKSYPTITELLEQEKTNLQISTPCLGSRFTSLVTELEISEGYV